MDPLKCHIPLFDGAGDVETLLGLENEVNCNEFIKVPRALRSTTKIWKWLCLRPMHYNATKPPFHGS
ncbi:hypothetical protein CR513_03350, partial [Mucuna pruriens]